jgi:hypothetical protein
LLQNGTIRRVIRGLYDYPRFSTLLDQELSPDTDQAAQALARKFRWRIQPIGAVAQNLLGLSTQVPARIVYLSERITPQDVAKIREWLDPKLRDKVLIDTRTATGWVYAAIKQIARENSDG